MSTTVFIAMLVFGFPSCIELRRRAKVFNFTEARTQCTFRGCGPFSWLKQTALVGALFFYPAQLLSYKSIFTGTQTQSLFLNFSLRNIQLWSWLLSYIVLSF